MAIVRGSGGRLRVGYQLAGTLGSWTVTTQANRDGDITTDVECQPVALDPYWSQQRPLDLELTWFGSRRVWRQVLPDSTEPHWRFHLRGTPEVI